MKIHLSVEIQCTAVIMTMIISLLQVWRIRLQVPLFKKQSVDLILTLPLGLEGYAVIVDK